MNNVKNEEFLLLVGHTQEVDQLLEAGQYDHLLFLEQAIKMVLKS